MFLTNWVSPPWVSAIENSPGTGKPSLASGTGGLIFGLRAYNAVAGQSGANRLRIRFVIARLKAAIHLLDYLTDAGRPEAPQSGQFVLRQIDLSEEQILRSGRCRACPLNE
jgi:hypothetical protein